MAIKYRQFGLVAKMTTWEWDTIMHYIIFPQPYLQKQKQKNRTSSDLTAVLFSEDKFLKLICLLL